MNNPTRTIGMHTLGRLLLVNQVTLRQWHRDGFLAHIDGQYPVPNVNRVLRDGSRYFEQPPQVDDLLAGRLTLKTAEEAMQLLRLKDSQQLLNLLSPQGLAAIKLKAYYRYSQQSIEALVVRRNRSRVSYRLAAHILGVEVNTVRRLLAARRLEDATVIGDGSPNFIALSSLLQLLAVLLPDWINAKDWFEDRLDSRRPLVGTAQAANVLGIYEEALVPLMDQRQIAYIRLPGRPPRRIPAESLIAYVERDPQLSLIEIAHQFGVTPATIHKWLNGQLLVCPQELHAHPEGDTALRRACLVAILGRGVSPGLSPVRWYEERLATSASVISLPETARKLGIDYYRLLNQAAEGLVQGLRCPSGIWVFSAREPGRRRRSPR